MIQVLGWTNKDNIGDEAYKLAFPKLFNKEFSFSEKIQGKPETVILGGGDVLYPSFFKTLSTVPTAKKYAFSVNIRPEHLESLHIFDHILCRNFIDLRPDNNPKIQFCPDFAFALEANKDNGKALVQSLFKEYRADLYDNLVIVVLNSFLCK